VSEKQSTPVEIKDKDIRDYVIFIASVIAIGSAAVWSLVNYASVNYVSKELYEANNQSVKERLQDVKDQLRQMDSYQKEMNEKILRYLEHRNR